MEKSRNHRYRNPEFNNNQNANANTIWYPDSSTYDHVTFDLQNLDINSSASKKDGFRVANKKKIPVLNNGQYNLFYWH